MKRLVRGDIDFLVARLESIDGKMKYGDEGKLPAPTEAKVEWHGIEDAVYKEMVPVLAFCLCHILCLQEEIAQ